MTIFRRILTGAALVVMASGLANANSIVFLSNPAIFGPQTTDFTYSLSLPDFNVALGTLTSAEIVFYAQENITTLTLTNKSSDVNSFTFIASANVTSLSTNSANAADAFGFNGPEGQDQTLVLFNQSMTLGPQGSGTCATATPTSSCNVVTFADTSKGIPSIQVTNNTLLPNGLYPKGNIDGVAGVVETITGADLNNYVGLGTFTLGGTTKSLTTFSGGGNNVTPSINTTAQFSAAIEYDYTTPNGTPEPTTMALMGGAMIGIGLLAKRLKRS